jgi:hypothetical protein
METKTETRTKTLLLPRSFCFQKGWKKAVRWMLGEWCIEVKIDSPGQWEELEKDLEKYFSRLHEARKILAHGSPVEKLEWARQISDERKADFLGPPEK